MAAGMLGLMMLLSGNYEPVPVPGARELCPQEVKVRDGGASLSVVYGGDCGDQGPFRYDCFEGGTESGPRTVTCIDGLIEFEVQGSDRYVWRNRGYGFEGEFVRVP